MCPHCQPMCHSHCASYCHQQYQQHCRLPLLQSTLKRSFDKPQLDLHLVIYSESDNSFLALLNVLSLNADFTHNTDAATVNSFFQRVRLFTCISTDQRCAADVVNGFVSCQI